MSESPLKDLSTRFDMLYPGGIERLNREFAVDFELHPDKYRSIRSADIEKYIRQYERAVQQGSGQTLETTKVFERFILTALDTVCVDQQRQLRGHFSQMLTAITNWEQYAEELGYEKMIWALLRSPHPSAMRLAGLLNDHRAYPDKGGDSFLEELAALPEVGREEARQEIRNYQRTIGRLERTVAEQQGTIARLESRIVPAAPILPSIAIQTASRPDRNQQLLWQLDEKNEELQTLRARVKNLEAQLRPAVPESGEGSPESATGNGNVALTFAEYRSLDQFYRGRRIITVGGYHGNDPMGTTRNYISFLRNSLGAEVESLSADINPQQLKGKLKGSAEGFVAVYFTYCSSHKLLVQIKQAGVEPVKVGGTTYDEQAFVRKLLTAVPKED